MRSKESEHLTPYTKSMDLFFFYAALLLYAAAMLAYFCPLVVKGGLVSGVATLLTLLAFGAHTIASLLHLYEVGYPPLSSLRESLSAFAWIIIVVYLFLELRYQNKVIGSFVLPIVLLALIAATALPKRIGELGPTLRNIWVYIHVSLILFGNAAFALASSAAFMYLIQERQLKSKKPGAFYYRLPSLELLDRLSYRFLSVGFPLLTLGLITGSIWAGYAWGSYWQWEPKQTWSLITWVIYAMLLQARVSSGWGGRKAAILSLVGFFCVLFGFLGINLLLTGLHAFF